MAKNKKQKTGPAKESPLRSPELYRVRAWAAAWPTLVNLLLLFITLEIAVLSIERVRWITPQPSLTLALVLAMLLSWWLARHRLPGALAHAVIVFAGLLLTAWQSQALIAAPDIGSRLARLLAALRFQNAAEGAPSGLFFAVFLVLVTWLIGYIATWLVVRRRNPWVGAALGALVVLVNLSNLTDGYYYYFGLYILAAALLITHARMTRHPEAMHYGRRAWTYIGTALLCIVVLGGSAAYYTPELRAPGLQTFIATHMLWKTNVEQSRLNFFNDVSSKQAISTAGTQREQPFGTTWHQGDKIDYIVQSARPSYWRVHVYDVYTAGGWENSAVGDSLLDQNVVWGGVGTGAAPAATTYTVSANLKTDIVLMGGSFISADSPTLVQVGGGDVVDIRLPRILAPGEKYSVTSRFYSPSPSQLASAGGNYPAQVAAYYLNLPADFPESVRQLSQNITRAARTPYEKVLAINSYLAKIPYQEKIKAPPKNEDGVAYFLFDEKAGFCLYYASAMAVMLRSVGVPARLAVGYLPGDAGQQPGEYILRDKHYHAWPQVFFNGYGWVDLEATPGGTGSGVTVETPFVSDEAIAQLPQWDVWLDYPPEIPNLPPNPVTVSAADRKISGGPVFFAHQLGVALAIIFAALLILAGLATPVLLLQASFYRWLWHVDRDHLSSLVYDRMCHLAAMARLGPRPQQTPLEFAAVLAGEFPEHAGAFVHVARSYIATRFGGKEGPGLFEEAELLKARCNAFDVLLKRLNIAGKITRGRV